MLYTSTKSQAIKDMEM